MPSPDELDGEIGTIRGVVFVDENDNPLPPYDPSKCPECGLTQDDGVIWLGCQFWQIYESGGSMTRWRCPNDHTWVT